MKNQIDFSVMYTKGLKLIALLLFLSTIIHSPLYGQDEMVTPPFVAQTSNTMFVMFHLNADEAQELLPPNVKVNRNEDGLATGGLEIYNTDQVSGMENFTIAFLTLEVEVGGEGNNDGTPGNWPVWGVINNEATLSSFKDFYNYPYHFEEKMTIEEKEDEQVATVGGNNGVGIIVNLAKNIDQPVSADGVATVLSQSKDGIVLRTEIPWIANGNQASVISFEVNPGNNEVLKAIQNATPIYGQISSNVFSYTQPLTQ